MLEVRHLKKRFGDVKAVDGVSFRVERGTCFGLLGPNGAGKTTTIAMIVGTLAPDDGEVLVDDALMATDAGEVKERLGYVPQELALYEDLSALDNLRFFGALYGLGGLKLAERAGVALQVVGLEERAKSLVRTFSGGMKRRLNIAIGLLHDPELIILDEPTVGVDPQSRNAIFECLERLKAEGKTLIYTSHYMEEVERMCDRIAIMDAGRVVANDTLQGLHGLVPAKSRISIELAGGQTLPDAIASQIEGHESVTSSGSRLTVDVVDVAADLPPILQWLQNHRLEVREVNSHRVSLEEVFLTLTGKSLRD